MAGTTELQMANDRIDEKNDEIEMLCDALRSVYALAGEVNGVESIVNEALESCSIE